MAFGYRESSGYEDENSTCEYEVSYQYLCSMLKQTFPDVTYEILKKVLDEFSIHASVMHMLRDKIFDEMKKGEK